MDKIGDMFMRRVGQNSMGAKAAYSMHVVVGIQKNGKTKVKKIGELFELCDLYGIKMGDREYVLGFKESEKLRRRVARARGVFLSSGEEEVRDCHG